MLRRPREDMFFALSHRFAMLSRVLSVTILAFCSLSARAAGISDLTTALTGINLVDVSGGHTQTDMTVIVHGRRIETIGKSSQVRIPKSTRVVVATGKYLIPGLWDMHVHTVFGSWIPPNEKVTLLLFVANGITGVRDMGGDLAILKRWRSAIAAQKLVGPRMVIAGPMLDGIPPRFPSSIGVADAESARKAVDDLVKSDADFIKIQSLITRDAYFAAADEAKKMKIPFVGHVPDAVRASDASNAGQKIIEHFTGVFQGCSRAEEQLLKGPKSLGRVVSTYDPVRASALIRQFARNATWQVPTLVWERHQWLIDELDLSHDPLNKYAPAAWKDRTWTMFTNDILQNMDTDPLVVRQRFVQMELEMTRAMHRGGVSFMAGTDTPAGVHIFPGFSLHDELGLFVKAGMTPRSGRRLSIPPNFSAGFPIWAQLRKVNSQIWFFLTQILSMT